VSKFNNRGNSQVKAKPGRQLITIVFSDRVRSRNCAQTSEIRPNPSDTARASCSPARVGCDRRAPRISNSCPSHSSSAFTCWLIALWLTPSSCAAAENPDRRTTASKARNAEKGRLMII